MPTASDFIPDSPQTVVLKPLTKGMDLSDDDQNSTSFRRISGADVSALGIKRHGVWKNVYSSALDLLLPDEKFQRIAQLILTDGDTATVVVTNKALYYFDATTGFRIVPWKQLFNVISTTEHTVVVAGDVGTLYDITAGDYLVIPSLLSPDGINYPDTPGALITSVVYDGSTNTTITVTESISAVPSSNVKIVKPFQASDYTVVDFACGGGNMYLVDGVSTMIWKFDGLVLDEHVINETGTATPIISGAVAIAYFKERLYFANVIDGSGGSATRIRWTNVLGTSGTAWNEMDASNYQDLETAVSPLMALKSTEDYLMAFTTSDVYYSRQTSLDSLPYAFYRAETGSVGAVGPLAITTVMNAVMFVGTDDVYVFTYNEDDGPSIKRLATLVSDEMLVSQATLRKTLCITDVDNSRVVVAIPDDNEQYPVLWLFNMKTNAWSVDESATFQAVTSSIITNQWRFSDFAPTPTILFNDPLYATRTFISFRVLPSKPQLAVFTSSNFMQTYDPLGKGATAWSLITKSLDFNDPTNRKVFTQAIVRADDLLALDGGVSITLSVRLDESATWRVLGTFLLTETQNEDILSFRATCRRAQFKFESTSNVSPWYLKYIALRVKSRGRMTAERRN